MDAAELVRYARRRTGTSQRDFAALLGVSARTVERVESGEGRPSFDLVSRALALADRELLPEAELEPPGAEVVAHLRMSLARRLCTALGGRLRKPEHDRAAPAWTAFHALVSACQAPAELTGPSALVLWLPAVPPPTELGGTPWPHRPPPSGGAFTLVAPAGVVGGVSVPMPGSRRLIVPGPVDLAADPACAAHRRALLAVARLLDQQAARDLAGRRAPAHKDPAHAAERDQVFLARHLERYPMPPQTDTRSWRLDDVVGLDGWLLRHGIPGQRRDREAG